MKDEVIHIEGLSKIFFTEEVETHALVDASFVIHKGEFVSITGASGCGKSTLLSLLGLLNTPTSGKFILNGNDVSSISKSKRAEFRNREIGFIFQAFNLISELTVYENVELPLTYRKDISKKQRHEMVEAVLEKVQMSHRSKFYPSQLSGGQQQRVAVARALAGNPSIILADEPTGNLDTNNAAAVMGLLDALHKEGATICMVTHDIRSARAAQRSIFLRDGRVVSTDHKITEMLIKAEDVSELAEVPCKQTEELVRG